MDIVASRRVLDDYGIPYSLKSNSVIDEKKNKFIRPSSEKYGKKFSKLMTKDQKNDNEKIYVCVRKRPLNANEIKKDEKNAIYIKGKKTIEVHEHKLKLDLTKYINYHYFTFDYAFDCDASNIDVYRQTGSSLIEHVFNGGTATYFSYGQTGSGKTYTMMNPEQGLFILAAKDIFKLLKKEKYSFISLYISFYEIYQGQLYDLLNNKKKVYARENNNQQVCIQGLSEYECFSEEKLMEIFMNGINNRVTSTTGSNPDSSRSHGIFQVVLKDKTKKNLPIYGKFIFIDLAGSERGADRDDTNKQTLLEGQEINKSLLALKECIRAIDRESKYTPFRQSKLTQVLKDSFIGNSKTCMITTISPSSLNIDHTLNTLRYAHRVKEFGQEIITNKPIINDSSIEKINGIKEDILKNPDFDSLNDSNDNLDSSTVSKSDKKKSNLSKYSKLPTHQHSEESTKKYLNQTRKSLPPISNSKNENNKLKYNKKTVLEYNENIYNNLTKSKSRINTPTKPHTLRKKMFSCGDINPYSMISTSNNKDEEKNYYKYNKSINKKEINLSNNEADNEIMKVFSEPFYSFSELKELENTLFINIKKKFEIDNDRDIPLKVSNNESFLIFNELINNTELILEKKMKLIKEIKTRLKSKTFI